MQGSSGHGVLSIVEASLKLQDCEALQISPKTEDDFFDLTSGILSKPFGFALIIPIRFAYEPTTFNVSSLKALNKEGILSAPISYRATLAHLLKYEYIKEAALFLDKAFIRFW